MKIVRGLNAARAALSRASVAMSYDVPPALKASLKKLFGTEDPEQAVRQIIDDVRSRGDKALYELTMKIDGVRLRGLEVAPETVAAAYDRVDKELVAALNLAAKRVHDFHVAQKEGFHREVGEAGLGQLTRPLKRVGVYVPGGTAAYPSTVLMTAVPARVAGVGEVVMATPPQKDGSIPPSVLVAADIAGVDRIYGIGGAQAVAALAYGTESVTAVDKICGPGNIFIMLAKKAVFGAVGIDALQGPSDVLIIADGKADPAYCAADLIAQAEHDALAEAHMVTTSRRLADEVNREIGEQLTTASRRSVAVEALERGVIAVVDSLDEAIELANLYAPEHLCLMVEKAADYIDRIDNAGCVFTGRGATVVLGDYVAGPSHALPTGGTARFSSPLNVGDFMKFTSVVDADRLDIKMLGRAASVLARAEGLDAHARAIERRMKGLEQGDK